MATSAEPELDPRDARIAQLEAQVAELTALVTALREENAELKRRLFGDKSEKMPSVARELRKRGKTKAEPAQTQAKRAEGREAKAKLLSERVEHRVPEEQRSCPHCGHDELGTVGTGKESVEYEYVQGYFRRRVHVRETLACRCGEHLVVAPAPARVLEGSLYGPGLIAHLVVAKCCDSMPLYRLEKGFSRMGIPLSRSTMVDLFHRAAELLRPLVRRMEERLREAEVVLADETRIKVQKRKAKAYVWCFEGGGFLVYRFSPTRSGETPSEVLGGTRGYLVVDGYTGYNQVTEVEGRIRCGCLAHVRRDYFEALQNAPVAQEAMELILKVYEVEWEAQERDLLGTEAHLQLRQSKAAPVMASFKEWLQEQEGQHAPKSPLGKAITYTKNQWEPITRFLENPKIPVDNNGSENNVRIVAIGRKNFLFVGHDQAGHNLAVLYSLVATCERWGINPEEYLADVLMRIGSHPQSRIDELLPDRWVPRRDSG